MQTRISKTLEGMMARTAFDTARAGIERSHKDYLMLEIMRSTNSMAYDLLASYVKQWQIAEMMARIEQEMASAQGEKCQPELFFGRYARTLLEKFSDMRTVSSLLAMLDIITDPSTASSRVFASYGIPIDAMAERILSVSNQNREPLGGEIEIHLQSDSDIQSIAIGEQSMLKKFGTDLTQLAREGKIDPVIGREKEIERVVQILSRRKKNNPVLIGEAGVGKSAIVEGLALRMASGEVPYNMAGKRLFSLDISSVVAGTKFRGEFEERMQQLMDELRRCDNTIIFIDEIHTIVGAGSTQGSLDTANMLKPALSRGEIQTIGATTLDEYRENIERDSALERRFQKVIVEPATREQTLQIVRKAAPVYENHHHVRYTEEALVACVELAERYVTDRHFPDKAMDILDEAGARAHIAGEHKPEALAELERSLADVRRERREAVESMVYDKAAAARIREIALRTKIGESTAEWHRSIEMNPVTVGAEEIAAVITSMTGVPAERISGSERERIRTLRDNLAARVVGQDEAVDRVAAAIRRSRSGLRATDKPIGVFMFVGPTGVGKTLLAKELSKLLFDERRGLIRIDMSEYGEKHNVSRLIGSPPGYVGYGEGGQLTEAVRRRPYSVVLFDEIEKAHPDVFNLMLQIFDEGHLTDGSGRRIDFRNTVIVMTSNVGSRESSVRPPQVGYLTATRSTAESSSVTESYRNAVERTFAPEFLNRVDDIIIFRTLTTEDVARIVDIELGEMLSRAGKLGYNIRITDEAKRRLADMGYESRYGARSLRRTLLDEVEEPLSTLIIEGKLHEGDTIVVDKSELSQGVVLNVA